MSRLCATRPLHFPLKIAVQFTDMTKKIILFDIDKTVYDGYTIFPLAQSQFDAGLIDASVVKRLNQDMIDYKNGNFTYEAFVAILLDHWAEGLRGKKYQEVLAHATHFFATQSEHFYPYVADVLELLKKTHEAYFVSGEPQFIAEAVGKIYGTRGWLSSTFELDKNGLLTGKVTTHLATKSDKKHALAGLIRSNSFEDSYGFGDSDADIEMLSLVQTPICINPNPGLLSHATEHKWHVATPENAVTFVK